MENNLFDMSEKRPYNQVIDQTLTKKLKLSKYGSKLNSLATKGTSITKSYLTGHVDQKYPINFYSNNSEIHRVENPFESKKNFSDEQKTNHDEVSRSDSDNKNQNTTLPILSSQTTTKEVKSTSNTKAKRKFLLSNQLKILSPTPSSTINKSISKIYAENKDSLQNLHNTSTNNSNSNISANYGKVSMNKKYFIREGKFVREAKGVGGVGNNNSQPHIGSNSKPKSVNKNINITNFSKLNTSASNVLTKNTLTKPSNKSVNLNSESKVMTIQSNINYNLNLHNIKLHGSIGTGSNMQSNVTNSLAESIKDNLPKVKNANPTNNNKLQPNNKFKDDRKFSILDIPASTFAMVKNESNSNNMNSNSKSEKEMDEMCSYQNPNQENIFTRKIGKEQSGRMNSSNNIQKINFNNDDVFGFLPMNPLNYGNFQRINNQMNQQQRMEINYQGSKMPGNFNFNRGDQNIHYGEGFNQSLKALPLNSNSSDQNKNTQQVSPQFFFKGELTGINTNSFNGNHTYTVGWQGNNLNENVGHRNSNTLSNNMNSTTQSNYITVTNNDESQLYQSLISELHMRKSLSKSKKNISALKSPRLKAFFLMLESEFLAPNLRLKMVTSVKPIYEISKGSLLKDHISSLIKSVKQLDEKYPEQIKNKLKDEVVSWVFKPSATSQLSLNHLTKKSEKIFCSLRVKSKVIDALFKVILLVFNVSESYSFENTLLTLYSKFKVDGLSKLN